MQYYNGTDYDVLYPMGNYQNMTGTPPGISGDISFSDISGTVTTSQLPTVPINKGGTGATTAATARSNLGITPGNIGAAASSHNHSASNITSGTLPLTRGGTGATSASGANGSIVYGSSTLSSLSTSYYLPVASSSSNGYKVSMSTLGNYIMNTFGGSSGGIKFHYGSYTGTGNTRSNTINTTYQPIFFYGFVESYNQPIYYTVERNFEVISNDCLEVFFTDNSRIIGALAVDKTGYERIYIQRTSTGVSLTSLGSGGVDNARNLLNNRDETYYWWILYQS